MKLFQLTVPDHMLFYHVFVSVYIAMIILSQHWMIVPLVAAMITTLTFSDIFDCFTFKNTVIYRYYTNGGDIKAYV